MNISYQEVSNAEIVHHTDDNLLVTSKGNIISILDNGYELKIQVPVSFYLKPLLRLRLIRRLLLIIYTSSSSYYGTGINTVVPVVDNNKNKKTSQSIAPFTLSN